MQKFRWEGGIVVILGPRGNGHQVVLGSLGIQRRHPGNLAERTLRCDKKIGNSEGGWAYAASLSGASQLP